jgi:hypothetical protein
LPRINLNSKINTEAMIQHEISKAACLCWFALETLALPIARLLMLMKLCLSYYLSIKLAVFTQHYLNSFVIARLIAVQSISPAKYN